MRTDLDGAFGLEYRGGLIRRYVDISVSISMT